MTIMRIFAAGIALAAVIVGSPAVATAESLAGQIGDKRYPVQFPVGSRGQCQKAYQQYIAASGHSAYAQTALTGAETFFCGAAIDVQSKEVAEERALANCKSVGKKYKMKTVGRCQIYVSK